MGPKFTAEPGTPDRLGASSDGKGVNFAIFSAHATKIELCLFDDDGKNELCRIELPQKTGDIWHGYVPDLKPGQALPEAGLMTRTASAGAFDRREPAFEYLLKSRYVDGWELFAGSAGPWPEKARAHGEQLQARYIPYGAAKLRIAVFPVLP